MKNYLEKNKQAIKNRVDNLDLTRFFSYATLKLLKPPTLPFWARWVFYL